MAVIAIIPARYASSRYPGKPLATLTGRDGVSKTLIQRSWEAARAVAGIDAVYVATDDDRIKHVAEAFGADVVMTSEECRNGTERCAEAARLISPKADIYVNFQGDAPLTPPWFVEALTAAMKVHPEIMMATPVLRCDEATYENFLVDRRNGQVGGTTAVFDRDLNALYFSKEVLPFSSDPARARPIPAFHHVGVYAYRPEALEAYVGWMPGDLEVHEGLEQLRFLENGVKVRCVEVEAKDRVFWELNNPVDIARIESVI